MAVNFVTQAQRDSLIELYIGYFNRAPEGTGLNYWSQTLLTGLNAGKTEAATMKEIANQFYGAGVQYNLYSASQPVESFIQTAYANALGRTSVDADGMKYWTAKLNSGEVSRGEFVQSLIKDAKAFAGDKEWGWVAIYMANRVAVGNSFTDNSTNLTGDAAIAAGVSALSIVTPATAQAGQTAAQAVATFQANGVGSSSNTFTLTNGTDIKTAHTFIAGQVYTPGGDVRINALQDEDQLTGTVATDDVLNATMGNFLGNGSAVITPKMTSVEIVNAAFTGSALVGANPGPVTALDLQDATGLTEVNITRVAQGKNAEVGNIKTAVAKMSLTNTNANQADTVEFSFAASVLKGDNTASMTLNSVDLGTLNMGQNADAGINALGVATNGFETMTLSSTGTANTVRNVNLPMDTGTAGKIMITGDQSLTLATTTPITNLGLGEAVTHGGGVLQANGRLASIDASGMTGTAALTLNIAAGLLTTGKADTSGTDQNVTITGSANADTFYLSDIVQAGDSIVGGLGIDTLVVYTGGVTTGTVTAVEVLDIQLVGNVTMDMDKDLDATTIKIRNIDNTLGLSADKGDWTVTLNNLAAVQAAALSINHSTTTNGDINDTTLVANLKSSTGTTDLVGITIAEGVNADARFNFTVTTNVDLPATTAVESVESITITDSDSESNSVELGSFAGHTGTITLAGGVAGTFLSLDVNTAAAPVENGSALDIAVKAAKVAYDASQTAVTKLALETAITAAAGTTGLDQIDVSGNAIDGFGRVDVGALATEVRLVAGVINAAAELANVTVRVASTAANTNGGQTITMGAGNDTVIFDDIAVGSATRVQAGLTNADTVNGGAGNNTLVIDGNGVPIVLQQSEWDNVAKFQTIYLAGNGAGNVNTQQYFLQLDNDLIIANGVNANLIAISNDDASTIDLTNNTDARLSNTGARIDALSLSANTHFTYDGEEGTGATDDRFVVNDQNTNGGNIIDGGDVNVQVGVIAGVTRQLAGVRSRDVLEVRNSATATTADLAGVSNVGSIVFNNDQSVLQTLTLTLNTATVDAMSDSGHTASLTEVETLLITANDALMTDAAGAAQAATIGSRLVVDARGVSGAFGLTVQGDTGFTADDRVSMNVNIGGAAQSVLLSLGTDTLAFGGTAANVVFAAATITFGDATGTGTQVFNVTGLETLDFSAFTDTASTAPASAANTIAYATAVTGVTTLTVANAATGMIITNTAIGALAIIGSANADTINGGAAVETLTGGAGADTIVTGGGADTVIGGAGADAVTLATAGTVESVRYVAATSAALLAEAGSVVGASAILAPVTTVADRVTTFVTAEDVINLSVALGTAAASGTLIATGGTSYVATNTLAAGDFVSAAGLASVAANTAGSGRFLFDSTSFILYYDASGDTTTSATGVYTAGGADDFVVLVGTATMVAGDFVFVA